MNDETLSEMINQLINGTISETDHSVLQERLKADPEVRAVLREHMDLEASLHAWATEGVGEVGVVDTPEVYPTGRSILAVTTIAAGLLVSVLWFLLSRDNVQDQIAEGSGRDATRISDVEEVGQLLQQADCVWKQSPNPSGRFSLGVLELTAGAAEMRFDSGTNVVLESPCEIEVTSSNAARLLAGNVFVTVTELSNGFTLNTPESQIIDEGTEYAVSLGQKSTEVHVFDGSVVWIPVGNFADAAFPFEDHIEAGEARSYERSEPSKVKRIPFGQRQFVRRIEASIRDANGEELLAYDGFENLAGKLRRGRSGFGWAEGWESAGRGAGQLAEVVDTSGDTVFGIDRNGRRQLAAVNGVNLRRRFESPINLSTQPTLYASLLAHRIRYVRDGQSSLRITLEPDSKSPRYTRRHSISFGITSEGAAYVNNAARIAEAVPDAIADEPCLLVFRYVAGHPNNSAQLRVYSPDEQVDETEPRTWTVTDTGPADAVNLKSVRISTGDDSDWQIDELRIGTSWSAVTNVRTLNEQ